MVDGRRGSCKDRESGTLSGRAAESAERLAILDVKKAKIEFFKMLYICMMLLVQSSDVVSDLVSEGVYFNIVSLGSEDGSNNTTTTIHAAQSATECGGPAADEDMGLIFNIAYAAHAGVSLLTSINTIRTLVAAFMVLRAQRQRRRSAQSGGDKTTRPSSDKERSKKAALIKRSSSQSDNKVRGAQATADGTKEDGENASELPSSPPAPPTDFVRTSSHLDDKCGFAAGRRCTPPHRRSSSTTLRTTRQPSPTSRRRFTALSLRT